MIESEEPQESSINWHLWFERGSWFVLIAGIVGTAPRIVSMLLGVLEILERAEQDVFERSNLLFFFSSTLQVVYDLAIVVAVFLILRMLIIAVPALVELKDVVVMGDDDED